MHSFLSFLLFFFNQDSRFSKVIHDFWKFNLWMARIFKTHLKTWSSKHESLSAEKMNSMMMNFSWIQDTTTKIPHHITQTNMLFWLSFQHEGHDFSLHGKYNFPTQLWRSHLSAMLPGWTSLTKIPTSPRLGFLRATTLNPRPPTEGLSIVIDSICLP